jgi:hypothetical protein
VGTLHAGGCVPATFKTLQKSLKKGNSVLVLVGGIAEMFHTKQDQEVIVLQRRRGFVRAALEAGVPLLPVYYFGQSQVTSFGPKCAFHWHMSQHDSYFECACDVAAHACVQQMLLSDTPAWSSALRHSVLAWSNMFACAGLSHSSAGSSV